jgi:BirA family biotin operon repressor/biotin-[acetyl-CoA-carboxylase] ligase
VDRNRLAALLIVEVTDCLRTFADSGFGAYRDEWQRHDALAGQAVELHGNGKLQHGQSAGVDLDGALRLRTDSGIVRVVTGEVSLRAGA